MPRLPEVLAGLLDDHDGIRQGLHDLGGMPVRQHYFVPLIFSMVR